jgi:hypothetical protein
MKVFLSASIPLPDRDKQFHGTADIFAIREAVKGLVQIVLERNGALVFGGHPAITPMVRLLFQQAGVEPRERVTLYQSALFRRDFPPDNAAFERIIVVPAVQNDRNMSLLAMRRRMFDERGYTSAVFIGGMEGVIEEFNLFRETHRDVPVFPVASTGAAAALLFQEHGFVEPSLINQLTYPTLFRRLLPDD